MTTRPGYVWDATASEWVEIGQAAVVAPVAYQASEPVSPATGDIWIDSDDEVPSVDSTLYYRWTKTMSGGETSLSGTDDSSLALEYTPGYESVFINGVLQVRGSDYVATTGTTVTGLIALTANDVVMVESIVAYSVGDTYTQSQMTSLLDAKSPVSTTGLVLISSTAMSGSSISVNNCFSANYVNYMVVISQLTSSATAGLTFRFRASGTDSSASYYAVAFDANYNSGAYSARTANNATAVVMPIAQTQTTDRSGGTISIQQPFAAETTSFQFTGQDAGTTRGVNNGSGYHNVSSSYDGFTLILSTGTFTSGTIKVYGYK